MNCEKTRICKETVIVYLTIVTSYLSGETEKKGYSSIREYMSIKALLHQPPTTIVAALLK